MTRFVMKVDSASLVPCSHSSSQARYGRRWSFMCCTPDEHKLRQRNVVYVVATHATRPYAARWFGNSIALWRGEIAHQLQTDLSTVVHALNEVLLRRQNADTPGALFLNVLNVSVDK